MITSDDVKRFYLPATSGESVPVDTPGGSWDRNDWQRVWLRAQSRDWRTLALVPGDDGTSTLAIAMEIAKLGRDRGESIHIADMRDLRLKHVQAFLDGTRWDAEQGDRIIFATRSAATNVATIPIARAADCAILCVSLGSTSLDGIRDTIEQIGRKHFLGSLLVRSSARPDSVRRLFGRRSPSEKQT